MPVYSITPPRGAPIRFQPNICSAIAWPLNTMLNIRFAKKIGEKVMILATKNLIKTLSSLKRFDKG